MRAHKYPRPITMYFCENEAFGQSAGGTDVRAEAVAGHRAPSTEHLIPSPQGAHRLLGNGRGSPWYPRG